MPLIPAGPRAIPSEEWGRKAIHLSAVGIPIALLNMSPSHALPLVGGLALVAVVVETFRLQMPAVGAWFQRRWGPYLRSHEHYRPAASTHLLLGAALAVLCFGPEVAALAIVYLAVGDPAAGLVGMRFGTHRVCAKSLEGFARVSDSLRAAGAGLHGDSPVCTRGRGSGCRDGGAAQRAAGR